MAGVVSLEAKGTYGKGLPGWVKGVAVVAAIGLGVYVIVKLNKAAKDAKATVSGRDEEKSVQKELQDMINSGKKPTLSPAQAKIFANSLFTAMDGYGTDKNAINKVFANCKNDADILAIISAFGIREISSGKLNPEPNYKGALGGAITSELSGSDVDVINLMLAKKGIKYKF